jgi:hypothetical protein
MYPPLHLLETESAGDFELNLPPIESFHQAVEIPAWLIEPAPEEIKRIAAD